MSQRRLTNVFLSCRDEALVAALQPDLLIRLSVGGGELIRNPNAAAARRPTVALRLCLAPLDEDSKLDSGALAAAARRITCSGTREISSVLPLSGPKPVLASRVRMDAAAAAACEAFDLQHTGASSHALSSPLASLAFLEGAAPRWTIGLVAGASGAGKSTQLRAMATAAAAAGGSVAAAKEDDCTFPHTPPPPAPTVFRRRPGRLRRDAPARGAVRRGARAGARGARAVARRGRRGLRRRRARGCGGRVRERRRQQPQRRRRSRAARRRRRLLLLCRHRRVLFRVRFCDGGCVCIRRRGPCAIHQRRRIIIIRSTLRPRAGNAAPGRRLRARLRGGAAAPRLAAGR